MERIHFFMTKHDTVIKCTGFSVMFRLCTDMMAAQFSSRKPSIFCPYLEIQYARIAHLKQRLYHVQTRSGFHTPLANPEGNGETLTAAEKILNQCFSWYLLRAALVLKGTHLLGKSVSVRMLDESKRTTKVR